MEDSKFEKPLRLLLKGLKQKIGTGNSPGFKAFLDGITISINNEIDMWDYYQRLFHQEESRIKKNWKSTLNRI